MIADQDAARADAALARAVADFNRSAAAHEVARHRLHHAMDAAEAAQVGRRPSAVCGTSSGYQKHQLEDAEADAACLEAHARDSRRATEARRARQWGRRRR